MRCEGAPVHGDVVDLVVRAARGRRGGQSRRGGRGSRGGRTVGTVTQRGRGGVGRGRAAVGRGRAGAGRGQRRGTGAKRPESPFAEASWTQEHATYIHNEITFTGDQPGHKHPFHDFPSPSAIFERFFSQRTLRKICIESNRYVGMLNDNGNPRGGGGN